VDPVVLRRGPGVALEGLDVLDRPVRVVLVEDVEADDLRAAEDLAGGHVVLGHALGLVPGRLALAAARVVASVDLVPGRDLLIRGYFFLNLRSSRVYSLTEGRRPSRPSRRECSKEIRIRCLAAVAPLTQASRRSRWTGSDMTSYGVM
jgi:hypothetical protein